MEQLQSKGLFLTPEARNQYFSDHNETIENCNIASMYSYFINQDIRRLTQSQLGDNSVQAPVLVQIVSVHNIAQPSKKQQQPGSYPQLLYIKLNDGMTKHVAIVLEAMPKLSVRTPPGTKLLLKEIWRINGKLLLTPTNTSVIGGEVSALIQTWKASQELKEKQRHTNYDMEDPPPKFIDFQTKKKATLQTQLEELELEEKPPAAPITVSTTTNSTRGKESSSRGRAMRGKRGKTKTQGKSDTKQSDPVATSGRGRGRGRGGKATRGRGRGSRSRGRGRGRST